MKASEALALGRLITIPKAVDIDRCAMGMILNAQGVKPFWKVWREEGIHRIQKVIDLHPWLQDKMPTSCVLPGWKHGEYAGTYYGGIVEAFNNAVMTAKTMTLDQLQAIIAEIEPDCGVCNRFACSCTPETVSLDNELPSLVQEHTDMAEQAYQEMEGELA